MQNAGFYDGFNKTVAMFSKILIAVVVVLLLTYLVTSGDSAILVVNTINAGGSQAATGAKHILVWAVVLTAIVASLIVAGGLGAIQSAMIIAAIPFTFIMILMCFSLIKALYRDSQRAKHASSAVVTGEATS